MNPSPDHRSIRASSAARLAAPRTATAERPPRRAVAAGGRRTDEALATALWCPHCKTPFVGAIADDGTFVHAACGGASELDLELLDDLADGSWFWSRYRDRVRGGAKAS